MKKAAFETMIHDITLALGPGLIEYPGDPSFVREMVEDIARGDPCRVARLAMSAHSGTHLDAPAHFIAGGKTLDAYPPYRFIVPAVVVEVPDGDVTAEAVMAADVPVGGALLFKTSNSRRGLLGEGRFREDFAGFTLEAARACADKGAGLVGIDYLSVERSGGGHPVHRQLLSREVLILEAADLREVPAGPYTLICLPLNLASAEASPVRALLVGKEE